MKPLPGRVLSPPPPGREPVPIFREFGGEALISKEEFLVKQQCFFYLYQYSYTAFKNCFNLTAQFADINFLTSLCFFT